MTSSARIYGALARALTPPDGEPMALSVLGLPRPEARAFQAEHVALFGRAGQARVSPYEGAHRDAAIHEVLASYAAVGYGPDRDFRDRPDHVCVELTVMGLLTEEAEKTSTDGAPGSGRRARREAHTFFLTRLWPWLPRFFEMLVASDRTPYHRRLGRFAKIFLEREGLRAGAEARPTGRAAPPPPSTCRECGRPLGFPLPDHMESRPVRGPVCVHCRVRTDLRRLKA